MVPFRGQALIGAIATFSGALLSIAGATIAAFMTIGLFDVWQIEAWDRLRNIREEAMIGSLVGFALYIIGRTLRPGAISQFGMMLISAAGLWITLSGVCFYVQYDRWGMQRTFITLLGSTIGALLGATGLMQRR
jgi:hypothetical protein